MSSGGEEEDTGPSVDSADPEERIAARRLRIQKRKELQQRYFSAVHFSPLNYFAYKWSLKINFSVFLYFDQ